jgi:cell division protein FtsB
MDFWYEVRRRLRHAVVPFLSACAAVYFGYHVVEGDRGLIAWLRVSQEIERAETAAALRGTEVARLEQMVALLRPEALDSDMLDERSRVVLGLAHPDEIIVLDR